MTEAQLELLVELLAEFGFELADEDELDDFKNRVEEIFAPAPEENK